MPHMEEKPDSASTLIGSSPASIRRPRRRFCRSLIVSFILVFIIAFTGLFLLWLTGASLSGLAILSPHPITPSPTNSSLPATPTGTDWSIPRRPPIDLENAKSIWFGGSLGKGRLLKVDFLPDGNRFVAMTMTGFYLYDIRNLTDPSFQFVPTRMMTKYGFSYFNPEVMSYAVSPVDGSIAVGYESDLVKIWHTRYQPATPDLIAPNDEDKLLNEDSILIHSTSMAYSPDGSLLAAGGSDNIVRLFHIPSGRMLGELAVEVNNNLWGGKWVSSVSFSQDGSLLASASDTGDIYIWRVSDGSLANVLQGHTSVVTGLTFSPDGSILASGSWDGTIRLWRVTDGVVNKVLEQDSGVASLAFSPNGITLAAGLFNGAVAFWQMPDVALSRRIDVHTDAVVSLSFSLDGAMLATGSLDSTVQFWNVADGSGLATLGGFLTDVLSLDFSPDDTMIAAGLGNGDIHLIRPVIGSGDRSRIDHNLDEDRSFSSEGDLEENKSTNFYWPIDMSNTGILHGHTGRVDSISFSPDGEFLASGSSDSSVRVWKIADGFPVATLRAHLRAVNEIAYSPDGALLASASEDGFIHLWNTEDWSIAGSLTSDGEPFTNVAFSPDGRILAAGTRTVGQVNNGGNVILWDLKDKSVVNRFRAIDMGDIRGMDFSADSSKLVVGSSSSIILFGVPAGSILWITSNINVMLTGVGFLPNGEILFCADSLGGNLCVFDAERGERIPILKTSLIETCKVVSHKGNMLASGTPNGFINLFYVY